VREIAQAGHSGGRVVDTNCDPSEVDYVIPGNDDALRATAVHSKISESIAEGVHARDDQAVGGHSGVAEPEPVVAAAALKRYTPRPQLPIPRRESQSRPPRVKKSAWKMCWARARASVPQRHRRR